MCLRGSYGVNVMDLHCIFDAGIRKVVVATDIASTSLTIDGIVYVIDAGFVKQKSFNPSTGLDALQVVRITNMPSYLHACWCMVLLAASPTTCKWACNRRVTIASRFHNEDGNCAAVQVPVSRSEAKQRTGRAGRTQAGMCFRLYGEDFEQQCMEDFSLPEIQRSSLTAVVLMLKTLGIQNVLNFPYMDPPEERMLLEALRQV